MTKRRNSPQKKDHEETTARDLTNTDTSKMSEPEFRITKIRILAGVINRLESVVVHTHRIVPMAGRIEVVCIPGRSGLFIVWHKGIKPFTIRFVCPVVHVRIGQLHRILQRYFLPLARVMVAGFSLYVNDCFTSSFCRISTV